MYKLCIYIYLLLLLLNGSSSRLEKAKERGESSAAPGEVFLLSPALILFVGSGGDLVLPSVMTSKPSDGEQVLLPQVGGATTADGANAKVCPALSALRDEVPLAPLHPRAVQPLASHQGVLENPSRGGRR